MLNDLLSADELALLQKLIGECNEPTICCHVNPDGDALGASLGWAEYLRSCGKTPHIIVPDQYPDFLQWLPKSDTLIRYDKRKEEADELLQRTDLLFCLDFNRIDRTDSMTEILSSLKAPKVLIDHHLEPDIDAVLMVSRPDLSSTSEMIFRIVWQLGAFGKMGSHFATPVYCGMMTDTGGFTYNSNSPEVFFIISQLLTKDINKDKIYRNVYNNYSENRLRLIGYVLYKKLVTIADCHAAFFVLTRNDLRRFHFIKGDAEGLVNMPLQIKGMKLSISLREDTERDNLVWVSLRSVDDFPCNKMAEMFFNGGGHLNASGGRLQCSVEEAVAITQRAILHFESTLNPGRK